MAMQNEEKKKIPVSPVNGQPLPKGRQFTSETAREAARKSNQVQAERKSITAAFMRYMSQEMAKEKDGTMLTGAEAVAKSIILGAYKGNAEMVKIALSLMGETPSTKIQVNNFGQIEELIKGLKEPSEYDIHTETASGNGAMADEQAEKT